MTPADHYAQAEEYLSRASFFTRDLAEHPGAGVYPINPELSALLTAMAAVHTGLAQVGATLLASGSHSPARAALLNAVLGAPEGSDRRVDAGSD